jgi:hypothetical protein
MAGRPRLNFNWEVVEALISMRASERYIAEYLLKKEGVSPTEIDSKMIAKRVKLLQRRIQERYGVNFVQFREQKQEDWQIKLRQLQRKSAENGNIPMQIFLGKNDLGQSDKMETKNEHKVNSFADFIKELHDEGENPES